MALIIVGILLLGYLLIATESVTNVNKAAVAIFVCTVGWVLYISYGTDFVMSQHPAEYNNFLNSSVGTSHPIKVFISQNIFLKYVGKAAEIVLFLLATMTIVEILNNNGCFDFITEWLRTRSSKRLLWTMSLVTFAISANLDNLTTATMMLVIMHNIVPSRKQRFFFGCAIVIAANCGGCFTVIGDPAGLVLWNMGAVTASNFSASLFLPSLVAWIVPTYFISKNIPERLDIEWVTSPYRGDDTNLNRWQRFLMLIVGIGGLWFIPTFHNITKLSPFLGALCVLSVLWIVNELVNRKLMNAEQMIQRRIPRVLQYGTIQQILFVLGIMLSMGVLSETGAMKLLWNFLQENVNNVWIYGVIAGFVSSVLDTFATAMSFIQIKQNVEMNDIYYKVIAFCVMCGGNVLAIGSMSGIALLKMERMHIGWYFRNVGWKCVLGTAVGFVVLMLANL